MAASAALQAVLINLYQFFWLKLTSLYLRNCPVLKNSKSINLCQFYVTTSKAASEALEAVVINFFWLKPTRLCVRNLPVLKISEKNIL